MVNKLREKEILFTYFEACNFDKYPVGGTLSFSKQILKSFPGQIRLVGIVNNNEPVGRWFLKEINGIQYEIYGICTLNESLNTKLPKRLHTLIKLKKHISNIRKTRNIENIFTQTPQFVFVLSKFKWKKFCFCFAGLGNSVALSKYKYLRLLGGIYEKKLIKKIKDSTTKVLAAADEKSINEKLFKYNLSKNFIVQFPTRFDNKIFKLKDIKHCRNKIGIPLNKKVLIVVGRLSYIKGWPLIIDSYKLLLDNIPELLLVFVGDGEDRKKIEDYCGDKIINRQVLFIGRKSPEEISVYLNAADVFIMASLVEGWPTSMVEALACGKVIVSTNISGATDMIEENVNGFIVNERNPVLFSKMISKALSLPNPNYTSLQKAQKYTLDTLKIDFKKYCLNEND